jgi:hypothetical protein
MDIAIDIHTRLFIGIAFFEIGDGKAPEVPSLVRLADGLHPGKIGIGCCYFFTDLANTGMIVIPVPNYLYLGVNRRACRLEQLFGSLRMNAESCHKATEK